MWSHYEFQQWVALGWLIPERYGPKSRDFMEASRKKQSHVRGQSCVSPECTTPDKVSVKSVKMISIYNILNNVTLDTLKVNLRNRVVFGGQYKITTHFIKAAPRHCVHFIGRNMAVTTRNIRRKYKSGCVLTAWFICEFLFLIYSTNR